MKFTPRRAREGINVSGEHPLVEASTLIAGLGLIFVTIFVALIFLIDVVLYFVPAEKELELFNAWLPGDLVTVGINDPRLESVDSLATRLSRHWPDTLYRFRIEIHDSPDVNAMALPGGLIVVSSGLLDEVTSENELAFIIGHEFGHFRNRDHIRGLGRGVAMSIMFAAIGWANGNSMLGVSIADLTLRGFSRRQEAAADRFGLEILRHEYGHVADAWRFFERIDNSKKSTVDVTGYLSTHPPPDNRIEAMIEYAAEKGWPVSGELTPTPW